MRMLNQAKVGTTRLHCFMLPCHLFLSMHGQLQHFDLGANNSVGTTRSTNSNLRQFSASPLRSAKIATHVTWDGCMVDVGSFQSPGVRARGSKDLLLSFKRCTSKFAKPGIEATNFSSRKGPTKCT
eukprot:4030-Amphidinium_carterae.1